MVLGEPVVIPDVQIDWQFTAFREIARYSHFRAVQSTPLTTEHGNQLGIVSTHFANVHTPSKIEMETLKAYGVVAAQYAFKLLGGMSLDVAANQMHEKLYTGLLGVAWFAAQGWRGVSEDGQTATQQWAEARG
jgi:hypothetical protein